MNKYTIYCSEAQTKKALELGASIETWKGARNAELKETYLNDDVLYFQPTAEQMIGWLEEQGIQISIIFSYRVKPLRWNYDLDNNNIILFEHNSMGYISRKEATLAVIDAALDYLIQKKIT